MNHFFFVVVPLNKCAAYLVRIAAVFTCTYLMPFAFWHPVYFYPMVMHVFIYKAEYMTDGQKRVWSAISIEQTHGRAQLRIAAEQLQPFDDYCTTLNSTSIVSLNHVHIQHMPIHSFHAC